MGGFGYLEGSLCCDSLPIASLSQDIPTPFYLYSLAKIKQQVAKLRNACGKQIQICFAVKANANLTILRYLALLGVGADVVSGNELRKAILAGIAPQNIVFSGVGKTAEELALAIDLQIMQCNVESAAELSLLAKIAKSKQQRVHAAIRINPNLQWAGNPKITTSAHHDKFGISYEEAAKLLIAAPSYYPEITINGLSLHLGSQIHDLEVFATAFTQIKNFVIELKQLGINLTHLDLGGGIGVGLHADINLNAYGQLLSELAEELSCTIIIEPGRLLVAQAGALITSVLYCKNIGQHHYTVVDASMTELMRPALYGASHPIAPLQLQPAAYRCSIVGPVCESSDVFAQDVDIPHLQTGDRLAILDTGAYGSSLANNYNMRLLPAEYAVYNQQLHLVRKRQTWQQLVDNELVNCPLSNF